jgi:serine/threonine protein kinase
MGAEASTPQVHRAPSNLERAAPPPPSGGGSSGGIGIGRNVLNAFSGQKLEDTCEIIKGRKPLGKGSFGTVWAAKLKNGKMAAVKALDKRRMKELKVPDSLVKAEVDLMREVSGKAEFVQLIDFVDTSASFFLVLEFCDGGDLEDATKADQDKLGERQVASFIKQMLEGLAHLHAKTICHRDIKPQNAMVVGRATSERAKVKLGDFGIAVKLPRDQLMKEKVGTPAFMAPEMHLLPGRSAGYDHKVDLWAMGAVMVFLLAHEYPFVDGSGRLMRDQLLKGDLPIWDANVFSGLFQRVQEVAGMKRPKPSQVAQDLVR